MQRKYVHNYNLKILTVWNVSSSSQPGRLGPDNYSFPCECSHLDLRLDDLMQETSDKFYILQLCGKYILSSRRTLAEIKTWNNQTLTKQSSLVWILKVDHPNIPHLNGSGSGWWCWLLLFILRNVSNVVFISNIWTLEDN